MVPAERINLAGKNQCGELGPVGIHREFITAAAMRIMAAKL
jgi:hypothetical protein